MPHTFKYRYYICFKKREVQALLIDKLLASIITHDFLSST